MKSIWCVILLYLITYASVTVAQDDDDDDDDHDDHNFGDDDDTHGRADDENSETDVRQKPIVPIQLSDTSDSFIRGSLEYIMVSTRLKFSQVKLICKENYNGVLAVVNDEKVANFLSEALSETNLDLDSLWIGGENKTLDDESAWYWTSYESMEAIEPALFDKLVALNSDISENRLCLAFGRSDHQIPQFRPLRCSALRSFICQRKRVGGLGEGNSTHPGWIRAARRRYKIYYDTVSWERASTRCARHNINAVLAVVPSYLVSELLGRYLLIGRPSLENAWIGARYDNEISAYRFESESDQSLSNITDANKYPPWKSNQITRTDACVLLDRHLTNRTLFVEARCERLRSYICSIDSTDVEDVNHYIDLFFDNYGYRYFFDMRSWEEAFETCETYSNYNGKLAEITHPEQLVHLLYVMGENRTDTKHLWVGGKYDGKEWVWATSGEKIDKDQLNFVANLTYTEDVESMNNCLNMDRENHIVGLHYGTDCSWRQHFACDFPADDLRKLGVEEKDHQNDERLQEAQNLKYLAY